MIKNAETSWILDRAKELGFPLAGVACVELMNPEPLRAWLALGYGAEMTYLERHLPIRANLSTFLPQARSVICVALPYQGATAGESPIGTVARYARGADYHDVMQERLQQLWSSIQVRYPNAASRIVVDSGPLPERELARRAGLGWVGRHSCLIHPALGSRIVLGEILTTIPLTPTEPITGDCGNCHRCIRACPTRALQESGLLDARRCLSYLTIEHKGPLPRELRPLLGTRLFGCDSCQDACPHNCTVAHVDSVFIPAPDLLAPDLQALLQLSPQAFNTRFRGTPLLRAKRRGLLRNACVVLGNLGHANAIPILRNAMTDHEPLIRGHAAWALGKLGDIAWLTAVEAQDSDPWVNEEISTAIKSAEAECSGASDIVIS